MLQHLWQTSNLPEVFSSVGHLSSMTWSPRVKASQTNEPGVELVANSWSETLLMSLQHLQDLKQPQPVVNQGEGIKTENPKRLTYTYNTTVTRSQIHQASRPTSQQCHHVLYLGFAGGNVGNLGDMLNVHWVLSEIRRAMTWGVTLRSYLEPQRDFTEARLQDSHPHGVDSEPSAGSDLSDPPDSDGPGLELS